MLMTGRSKSAGVDRESEVPVEKGDGARDREAKVPQAAAAIRPAVEAPAAKRAACFSDSRNAKDPIGTQKKDERPGPASPSMPVSHAPKYTDDDGDLRDTATTPKGASAQDRGGHAQLREHALPGASGGSTGAETCGGPAFSGVKILPCVKGQRGHLRQHVLAREANEPFMYAFIRNKAITWERATAEEWKKANETAHIMFPTCDRVLERAVHNDYMYGALDAIRVAGRIDQEYINPHDRKTAPWADAVEHEEDGD